jgi:hypothetical protein
MELGKNTHVCQKVLSLQKVALYLSIYYTDTFNEIDGAVLFRR